MSQIIKTQSFEPIRQRFLEQVDEKTFNKEVGFAVQIIGASTKLQECTPESLLKAVYNISLTGLTLNPVLKQAYLTPRWNGTLKKNECLLMPSYMGLTKLGMEAGGLPKIEAQLVYDGDVFEVEFQPVNTIIHKRKFKSKSIIAVYAVANLPGGLTQFEVMDAAEVHEIRECSDGWKAFKAGKASSSIWNDYEGEMTRKTVIKRLLKYLPKVKDDAARRYGEAERLDNVDYMASDAQVFYIDSLLMTSTLGEDEKEQIENSLGHGLTHELASGMIEKLKMNQQAHLRERGVINNAKQMNKSLDSAIERE